VEVYWHGRIFVLASENNLTPGQQAEFNKTEREVSELFSFVEQHRIYLPDSVCTLLDKFVGDVRGNVVIAGIFGRIAYPNEQTLQQSHDAFTKGYEEFEKDIPEARRALEIAFRKILGVEQENAQGG
jgi:hypothetical protein